MPPDRRPPIVTRLRETLRLLPHIVRTFRILWETSPLLGGAVAALTVATGVIPAAIACFNDAGSAVITRSRNPNPAVPTKMAPATNTPPSATCHGTFMPTTTL